MSNNDIKRDGLYLGIWRQAGMPDCTNGGISANVDRLTLVGGLSAKGKTQEVDRIVEASESAPAVILRQHTTSHHHAYLVPAVWNEDKQVWEEKRGWAMYGGHSASGDSRVNDLYEELTGEHLPGPIHIHDRYEN